MESIKELKKIVEKGVKRDSHNAMYYIEPLQVYITWVLLKLGFNRISASLLWLFLGIVASLLFLTGNIYFGLAAIALHYLQTILDGCDGQIARYNKPKLNKKKDVELWIKGLYLDYNQHIIIDTLTLSFFAIGLYRISGHFEVLILGVLTVYVRMYKRTQNAFLSRIYNVFRNKEGTLSILEMDSEATHTNNIVFKIINKFFFWIKNGKRLYLLILLFHISDIVIPETGIVKNNYIFRIIGLYFISIFGITGILVEQISELVHNQLIRKILTLKQREQ